MHLLQRFEPIPETEEGVKIMSLNARKKVFGKLQRIKDTRDREYHLNITAANEVKVVAQNGNVVTHVKLEIDDFSSYLTEGTVTAAISNIVVRFCSLMIWYFFWVHIR